jgi:hypothetical protein
VRSHGRRRRHHQGGEGHWEAMRALSSRPFCSCDSRGVSLQYLAAGCRYTAPHLTRDSEPHCSPTDITVKHAWYFVASMVVSDPSGERSACITLHFGRRGQWAMALRAGVVCVVAIVAQAPSPALALRAMPAPHLRAVASGAYPLTPLSSLITTARACLHSVSFFPYGKDGFAPLPLPGSGSPHRTGLLPQQESARSQARSCSACASLSACCASSLQGIARDGWGSLASRPVPSAALRLAAPGHESGLHPGAGRAHTGACQRLGGPLLSHGTTRGGVRSCQSADVGRRHYACRGKGARSCLVDRALARVSSGGYAPPRPRRSLRSGAGRAVFY